jgi:hypothetical protein
LPGRQAGWPVKALRSIATAIFDKNGMAAYIKKLAVPA